MTPYIGTAGWSIPKNWNADFPSVGTHLERYARTLPAVEINSSFYRPHRDDTWKRWADSVPDQFRFSVKIPKIVSHADKLQITPEFDTFCAAVQNLGPKLGALLVQFPPHAKFNADETEPFFHETKRRFEALVACEPRHKSWFTPEAGDLLKKLKVARVAADPFICPEAGVPGGWLGAAYYRLHGSPRRYYSTYEPVYMKALAEKMASAPNPTWCIFDNTALGAATGNALELLL